MRDTLLILSLLGSTVPPIILALGWLRAARLARMWRQSYLDGFARTFERELNAGDPWRLDFDLIAEQLHAKVYG